MKNRFCRNFLTGAPVFCALALMPPVFGQSYTVVDVPGSLATDITGINPSGTVTGAYTGSDNHTHGYIRDRSGNFTTFDLGGSVTFPVAISADGTVVGVAENPFLSAFVRDPRGHVTTFTTSPTAIHVTPVAINSSDTVAGSYLEVATGFHGFIREATGEIEKFDVPLATGTFIEGISDSGAITGTYVVAGVSHCYVREEDGRIVSFDVPGAISAHTANINPRGDVVGYWVSPSDGHQHGFIRDRSGAITVFDPPGSFDTGQGINVSGIGHAVAGISPNGMVTGAFFGAGALLHGFVRDQHGSITVFDPPVANLQNTKPAGMTPSGTIAGTAETNAGSSHGFIRSPR